MEAVSIPKILISSHDEDHISLFNAQAVANSI